VKRTLSYVHAIPAAPYPWHLYLFVDREKWARYQARRYGKLKAKLLEVADADGICKIDDTTNECFVGVFNGRVGTLAHEITHASTRILACCNVPFSDTNDEALAYLVGYLVDSCWPEVP